MTSNLETCAAKQSVRADFTCACLSPKGRWVYCAGEDGELFCFDAATTEVEKTLKVSEKEIIGLAHHPHRYTTAKYVFLLHGTVYMREQYF